MKTKNIIVIAVIIAAAALIVLRLISNKQNRDAELNAIKNFNPDIPVNVDTVKYLNPGDGFTISGSFEAGMEVTVASETQGSIKEIFAETGMNVKENQPLAKINNDVILSRLNRAKANYEKASKDMKRFEQLSKEDAASLQQFEAAKLAYVNAGTEYASAQEEYEHSVIKAPVSGVITNRYIEKGSFISPGTQAFDIVNISKVKFVVQATATQLEALKKGSEVKIKEDLHPENILNGKVYSVSSKADESKRFRVEIEVQNTKDNFLKPGMFGTLLAEGNTAGEKKLVIPRQALTGSIKNPEVFIINGEKASMRNIKAIPVNDVYLEVISGLNRGEVVVTSGQINLKEGTQVKVNREGK